MSSALSGLIGALGGGPGGGGAPDPTAGLGGGPSGGPDDTTTQQYSDPVDALNDAETALHAYIQMEQDDGDRAIAAQCLQQIIKLKAKDSMDLQKLHSALQGAPAAPGGPPGGPPPGPMG